MSGKSRRLLGARLPVDIAVALIALALLRVSVAGPLGKNFGHVLILDDQGPSSRDQIDSYDTNTGVFKGSSLTLPSSNRRTLVAAGDEASVLVPANDQLGSDWTTPGFNDAGWMSGPTGVGYGFEADPGATNRPIIYFGFETREGEAVTDGQTAGGQVDESAGHPEGPFHGVGTEEPTRVSDGLSYSSDVPAVLAHSRASIEFDEFNPNPEAFEVTPIPDAIRDMTLGDFTMHTWFKSTDEGRSIFMGSCCTGNAERLNFELHTGNRIRIWINGAGATTDLNVSVAPGNSRDGEWHSGTAVRRGENVELYFDGRLVGEMLDVAGSFQQSQLSYFFGRDSRTAETRFDGNLDDVAFWNVALETEEIEALAAGAQPTSGEVPEPIAYWDFETKEGDAVEDGESAIGQVDETAGHPDGPFDGVGIGEAPGAGGANGLNYSEDAPDGLDHSRFSIEIDESGRPESFVVDPMPDVLRQLTLGDMTIHTWFKTTDTGRSIFMGSCCNTSGSHRLNFELHTDNRIRAWINGPGATTDFNIPVTDVGDSRDGEWHSGAMVRRGESVELYYEGILIGQTQDVAGAFEQLPPAYFFGRDDRTGDTRFSGKLDDIAIWNKALSPGQIEALARGASPLELPDEGEVAAELIGTDIEGAMRGINASAYVRIPFEVAEPDALESLTLEMRYDDGFIAYLNGEEVARRNAPDVASWDSSALGERGGMITLVSERSVARTLVPTGDELGTSWTTIGFDDTGWIVGRPGIGYDATERLPGDSPRPIAYWPFETSDGVAVEDMQSSDLGIIDELADHPDVDGPLDGVATGGVYSADAAPLAHSSFSWVVDEAQPIPDTFEITPMPTAIAELPLEDFTMHTWFKCTDPGRSIFMGSCCTGANNRLNFELHTGNRIRIWINGPSATSDLNVPVTPGNSRDGEWHAGTAVRRGDSVELYFDGELVGQMTDVAGSFVQGEPTYYFGRDSRVGDTQFDGKLDDIAFWNLALSTGQIASLAKGASPLSLPPEGSIGAQLGTDLVDAMRGTNPGAYTRIAFEVEDPADLSSLLLRMRYDDGFIAYLNGEEVARRNAPDGAIWNSAAPSDRDDGDAGIFEDIDVSQAIALLQAGTNVLAIHGLNASADASAFLVLPELLASRPGGNARALIAEKIDISDSIGLLDPGRNVLAIHGLNSSPGADAFLILPELVTTVAGQEATGITASEIPGIAYAISDRGNLYEVDWFRGTTREIADLGATLPENALHARYESITSLPGSDLLYILRSDRGSGQFDTEDLIDTYDPTPGAADPYTREVFMTRGFTAVSLSDGPPFPPFGDGPALYTIGTIGELEVFDPASPGTGQIVRRDLPEGTAGDLVSVTAVPGDDFQIYVLQDSNLDGDTRDRVLVFTLDGELENLIIVDHDTAAAITDLPRRGHLFTQARNGPAATIDLARGQAGVTDLGRGASNNANSATSIAASSDPEKFVYIADDRGAHHLDVHDARYIWAAGSTDNVASTPATPDGDWADSSVTDGGRLLWQLHTDGKLYRIDPDTGDATLARDLDPPQSSSDRSTYESITNLQGDGRLFILRTDRPVTAKTGGGSVGIVDVFRPEGAIYTTDVYTTLGTGMMAISDGPPYNRGDVSTGAGGAVYLISAGGSFEVLDPEGSGTTTRIRDGIGGDGGGMMVSITNLPTDATHMYALRDREGDDGRDRVDVLDLAGGAEFDAFELEGTDATSITDTSERTLLATSADGVTSVIEVADDVVYDFDADVATHHVAATNIDLTIPEPPRVLFVRGDTNADTIVNISDGVFVLNFLFLGGTEPTCRAATDTNDDGGTNIGDGIFIFNFLFLGGPNIPPPNACDDPQPAGVDCEAFGACTP